MTLMSEDERRERAERRLELARIKELSSAGDADLEEAPLETRAWTPEGWKNRAFHYWYDFSPDFATRELENQYHSRPMRTVIFVGDPYSAPNIPVRLMAQGAQWVLVRTFNMSPERECPHSQDEDDGDDTSWPEAGCLLCETSREDLAAGEGHGQIYLGEGWQEAVYVQEKAESLREARYELIHAAGELALGRRQSVGERVLEASTALSTFEDEGLELGRQAEGFFTELEELESVVSIQNLKRLWEIASTLLRWVELPPAFQDGAQARWDKAISRAEGKRTEEERLRPLQAQHHEPDPTRVRRARLLEIGPRYQDEGDAPDPQRIERKLENPVGNFVREVWWKDPTTGKWDLYRSGLSQRQAETLADKVKWVLSPRWHGVNAEVQIRTKSPAGKI